MGSLYVLEAARKFRFVRAIIMVTSDKCYENKEWIWPYRESDSMGGLDPYSNSKGCAELLIHSYRQSFFSVETYDSHQVGLASVRAGNVIGGGDFAKHRLIPDIIRALLDNQKVMLRHPDAIRPWQHVLEPLSGYLLLAERLYNDKTFSEGWNFGPSDLDAQPVSDIVDKILSMWPNHKGWEVEPGAKPHEAHYLKLDCSKARTYLGYSPSWDLVRSLEKIIEWYQAYASHNDMRQISLRHIQEFQSK
jgi:CDP-glucose 4,6-dehydratase